MSYIYTHTHARMHTPHYTTKYYTMPHSAILCYATLQVNMRLWAKTLKDKQPTVWLLTMCLNCPSQSPRVLIRPCWAGPCVACGCRAQQTQWAEDARLAYLARAAPGAAARTCLPSVSATNPFHVWNKCCVQLPCAVARPAATECGKGAEDFVPVFLWGGIMVLDIQLGG